MLAQESQLLGQNRGHWTHGPAKDIPLSHHTPAVLNTNFIVTESRVPQQFHEDNRTRRASGDYVQPRWEEGGRSTNAERGSVDSGNNDVNLVLASTEYRDGMVIKRFREFNRTEVDGETKSISNRSVISESSRLNSVTFRPYNPVQEMDNRSQNSLTKDGLQQLDDTKSEQLFLAGPSSNRKDYEPVNFTAHKIPFNLKPVDDLVVDNRLNGSGVKSQKRHLESLPLGQPNGKETTTNAGLLLSTERQFNDPRQAAALIRGEIAEADLVVENVGRFEGELVDGRMSGYGRLYDHQNRILFEGDFVGNEYEGVGILYNHSPDKNGADFEETTSPGFNLDSIGSNWLKYEGLFKRGRFHGTGHLHLPRRLVLVAQFEDGQLTGEVVVKDLVSHRTKRIGPAAGRPSKSD